MKSKIYIAALLLMSPVLSFSQKQCGTETPADYLEDVYNGVFRDVPLAEGATFELPMKMRVIARDDGSDAKMMDDVYELLCDLNTAYTSQNIQFWLYDYPEVINSTNLHVVTNRNSGASKLMTVYNEPYVVNVYFADLTLTSDPGLTLCGYAYLPGTGPVGPTNGGTVRNSHNQGGVMLNTKGNCTRPGSSTTFTHELGHFFSLLHPFQNTSDNPGSVNSEYVTRGSGANCNTAGDGLCDTEADYCSLAPGQTWSGCAPAQSVTDFNGDTFIPDPSLYMSYSPDGCQNKFTSQQASQIAATMNLPTNNNRSRGYLKLYSKPNLGEVTQAATLSYPNGGQNGVVPNYIPMRWSAVPNATDYHLQISTNASFSRVDFETVTSNTYFLYTDQAFTSLNPGARLYWRIKPMNKGSFCQPFSGLRFFSVGSAYPASVEDLNSNDLKVFPNILSPGQAVNIYFGESSTGETNLSLMDLNGKRVVTKTVGPQIGGANLELNPGTLSPGMYLLQINRNGEMQTEKIVVR